MCEQLGRHLNLLNIFKCNINIRSVRNKLLNYTFFKISPICITESHLDVNINNDDLLLDFFSKTFIRKDRNNSGSGLLIYWYICWMCNWLRKRHWRIRVITKLPNSEQSYKGKVKTHNYTNRQKQSTTGKLDKRSS